MERLLNDVVISLRTLSIFLYLLIALSIGLRDAPVALRFSFILFADAVRLSKATFKFCIEPLFVPSLLISSLTLAISADNPVLIWEFVLSNPASLDVYCALAFSISSANFLTPASASFMFWSIYLNTGSLLSPTFSNV